VLGPPETIWAGATERSGADDHVAYGGLAASQERRHLLLPVLNTLQSEIGWISHGALNYVSERVPVSPAEAFGVASFYELLATEPRPPRVAHVCDDIACLASGAADQMTLLEEGFGPEGTVVDGAMWLRSPCLGQCDRGSAAFIQVAGGDDVVLAPAPVDQILDLLGPTPSIPDPTPPSAVAGSSLLGSTPETLDAYLSTGGYGALRSALAGGAPAVVEAVEASGLRGRGGAAFPAGIKWASVAAADSPKYVVCNADESEPGTFKDRAILEANPYLVIEATTIAGFAVGATKGYIYLRGEYPVAFRRLRDALTEARSMGLLGGDLAGSEFSFDIELRRGAGAYICGEETSLFNSIEGYRGEPRQKPPFPTEAGLFGRPTLVNNVESLANIPSIVADRGMTFSSIGTAESKGPKLFCVSGNVRSPGVFEVPFGATTRDLVALAGGSVGDVAAVLTGGAAGGFISLDQMDVPLTFEDTRAAGIALGSGVVMVFNTETDITAVVNRIAHFFEDESCGLCVPCRVGTVRQSESLVRLATGNDTARELAILDELDVVLRDASICGLGQLATGAVQSAIALGLVGGRA
jgi:NADH-quinone oxidoreductase subunit F